MKIVLDTNVLVSALLSRSGPPAQILTLVLNGVLQVVVDSRIIAEYRAVLARPEFGFPPREVEAVLTFLGMPAHRVDPPPRTESLPDESDRPFLEVARGAADVLVTGNVRHFPISARGGLAVLTPRELVAQLTR